MKKIDSDALGILTKALGLTGSGSPITELEDGIVDQTLSVGDLVRRGRTQAGTSGLYTAILQNVHTDAEALTVAVNPYNIGAGVIPPWPDPMPPQFDIWLLNAAVRRASGAGTLAGVLHYQFASGNQGWGVNDSGVAVVESAPVALAYWTSIGSLGTTFGVLADGGGTAQPSKRIGIRLPRGTTNNGSLEFTSLSSLTSTYDCQLLLGVFPVALGQDGLV